MMVFGEIGLTELLVILDLIFAVLTFIVIIFHSRRIVYLFNWVLDYLQATTKTPKSERGCPKCDKPMLGHTIEEARKHGIIKRFMKEMRKQVESSDLKV